MIKEKIGDVIYYFSDENYEMILSEPNHHCPARLRQLMAHAIIDVKERKIIKNRFGLEAIFSKALKGL